LFDRNLNGSGLVMTAVVSKRCAPLVAGFGIALFASVAHAAIPAAPDDPAPNEPAPNSASRTAAPSATDSATAKMSVKLEAALASPPRAAEVAERARGTALWLLALEHTNRRAGHAGVTDGYDVAIHSAWLNQRPNLIAKQHLDLALGGSSAGVEFDFAWMSAIGVGLTTFEHGLIYVQGGLETYYRGNPRVHTGLVSPLAAIGHAWTSAVGQLDIGARLDLPLLGGIEISGTSTRLRRHPDVGGYASARYGPLWLIADVQQRELDTGNIDVLQVRGAACAGRFVIFCTRVHEHWMSPIDRHITEVSLTLGVGSLSHTD
jgi:hypothetical protein